MKECVKQAIVRSCVSPLPIHPLMDFHSGRKNRKPERAGRICAWQHFPCFFLLLLLIFLFFSFWFVFFSSFSSNSSPPTFYFYIYGLFSFGTSNLNRVIRTASKSEYCDSTLILRKCQMQRYSSFVTFEPLPVELFRNFYCSIATLGQHLRFRLCFIY